MAYQPVDPNAQQVGVTPVVPHGYLSREYAIKEAGYVYMYISNENPTQVDVYFDDVTMTYTPSNVIQSNEYYPFGMQTANSWTRENTTGNNFLGNGGTELNTTSNLYDLDFRNYDPVLGRMHQVDPMAGKYSSVTPYNFSFNDPVTFNDPNGASPVQPTRVESQTGWYINGPVNNPIMDTGTYGGGAGNRINASYFGAFGLSSVISGWNPNYSGPMLIGQDNLKRWIYDLPTNIEEAGGLEAYMRQTNFANLVGIAWNSTPSNWGGKYYLTNGMISHVSFMIPLMNKSTGPVLASAGTGPDDPKKYTPIGHQASDWYNTTLGSIFNLTGITLIGEETLSALQATRILNAAGLGITIYTISVEKRVSTSSALDLVFGGLAFTPAAPVSLGYFALNFASLGFTGKSLGENIDENFYIVTMIGPSPFILIPKNH